MSSCCGNTPNSSPERRLISLPVNSPATSCDTVTCSSWTDDRLAGVPQSESLQIMGRNGRGWLALSAQKSGFVVCEGGRHRVTDRPKFQLPLLRKLIPATDGSGQFQATPEGELLEDFPPLFKSLVVMDEYGQWNSLRGPSETKARLQWNGYFYEMVAPDDGRIKGPLPLVDSIVLIGTSSQSGCDEYEQLNRLDPRAPGFIVSDGVKHYPLPCTGERQPPVTGIKVYSLMACTNQGPMSIPLPETGIFAMCGGGIVALEAPRYTSQDFSAGTIPSGKNVGDFVVGATLATDGNGCLGWNTTTVTSNDINTLVFRDVGAQQYATAPPWATKITIKAWGAGGSYESIARGGVGGFTEATFPVAGGDQFSVMVGTGGVFGTFYPAPNYGFAGLGSPDGAQQQAGGLSGVFRGNGPILITDDARALVIAGGGGAGGVSSPSVNPVAGGNGNAVTGGGMANFQGQNATNGMSGIGAGGGGFRGGTGITRSGRGGSGYIDPAKISGSINSSPDATVPSSGDPDYVKNFAGALIGTQGAPGGVVVIWS